MAILLLLFLLWVTMRGELPAYRAMWSGAQPATP